MPVTREQALAELARRELARRQSTRQQQFSKSMLPTGGSAPESRMGFLTAPERPAADMTRVDQESMRTPYKNPLEGMTQKVLESQGLAEPLSMAEGLPGQRMFQNDTAEKARRFLGNLVMGPQRMAVGMPLGAVEDPVGTAKGLLEFVPEAAETANRALGFGPIGPSTDGSGNIVTRQISPEDRSAAQQQMLENPFDYLMAAAPILKGVGAAMKPAPKYTKAVLRKAPVAPVEPIAAPVETAKIAKTAGRLDPLNPPYAEAPITAVKTADGSVYYDKSAKIHADLVSNGIVNASDVIEGGFISPSGTYYSGSADAARIGEIARAKDSIAKKRAARRAAGKQIERPVATEPADVPTPVKESLPVEAPKATPPAPSLKESSPAPSPLKVETVKAETVETKPGEAVGLSKAELERIQQDYPDLEAMEPTKKKGMLQSFEEAKRQGIDARASELADEVLASNRPISDTEVAGLAKRHGELLREYEESLTEADRLGQSGEATAATAARSRADAIETQLDNIRKAARFGSRETGRALNMMKTMVDRETFDFAAVTMRARSVKGGKLTPEESTRFKALTDEVSVLETKLKDAEAKWMEAVAEKEKIKAEKVLQRQAALSNRITRRTEGKARLKVERDDLKKRIAQLGYRVNDITGVSAEASYLVGRLAINYIREGAMTMDQLVAQVLKDVPELTARDVYRALIERDPNRQFKARSEVQKRIANLKTQADLLVKIEKAEKGVFESPKGKTPAPFEIANLRKQLTQLRSQAYKSGLAPERLEKAIYRINELQDQLAGQYRNVKKGRTTPSAELQSAREKMADLKRQMYVQDEIARLDEQMRTGQFEVKDKPVAKEMPPDIERAEIALRVKRKQVRQAIEDLRPMTTKRVVQETLNTARTLKATADMSAALRQGLVLSAMRPVKATMAFGRASKAFFSKYSAEQIDLAIRGADHQWVRDRAGLYLSPLEHGVKAGMREEMFQSNVLNKIPVLKQVIQASERHMVSHLNMLRTAAFDEFYLKNPNATRAELAAWADFVNVASGRGNLGKLGAVSEGAAAVMFAPRFAVSRFQTPYKLLQYAKIPRVRKAIAKDIAGTVGLGITALTLAQLGGAEVGLDPRSPDFGKIKVGNTRVDIWAGFQQPARLVARLGLGATDRAGLTGRGLKEKEKQFDPVEAIGRFAAFKLAPTITIGRELYTGKTAVGDKTTPLETAARSVVPLVYEDIQDAFRDGGWGRVSFTGPLSFVGVGVSTYDNSKKQTKKRGL